MSNLVLSHVTIWFAANNAVLNLDKMSIIKFITKNSLHSKLYTGFKEKYIEETVHTKLLGLQSDNHINWKNHIEQIISKLNAVCYAVRSMVQISNINTLKSIYYAYCHSSIQYGINFGGNSSNIYKRKSSKLWLVHNPDYLL